MMRDIIHTLQTDAIPVSPQAREIVRERTNRIRNVLPDTLLTTALTVRNEWNELSMAVWDKISEALGSNDIAKALDQMQFLQRILETKVTTQGITYLNKVWKDGIPKQYQPVEQYKNVVVVLWYAYCTKQRDAAWNGESYGTVRAKTRDMLMRRSSTSTTADATGILGGFTMDDGDDGDTDTTTASVTWTIATTTMSKQQHNLSYSDVQKSIYWKIFLDIGLERLEQDFLKAVQKRLVAPVHLMFPDILLDENAAVGLPSKYDLQRFDETIRNELKFGIDDPSMIPIVAERVTLAVAEFCQRAAGTLIRGKYLSEHFQMTSALQQDRKIVAILYALHTYLTKAPKTIFGSAGTAHEDCAVALGPAVATIDSTIQGEVVRPVVKQLNQQLYTVVSRPYGPEFVQSHVAPSLERLTESILKKFPPVYSSLISNEIAEHIVLAFITTVSLIRPMTENNRLQITQDLADLELSIQQLATISSEKWINSKAYAELRATRQMLYWTGLEQSSAKTAPEVAKSILRELWLSDVRPSTVFHYLFSFAPSALSAPHHVANLTTSAYVEHIVAHEETTWIMVCCDRYEQRGTSAASDGDARVAQIVLALGQELLRRRGRNE